MITPSKNVALQTRDLYGSRLRCLLLTHQPKDATARLLAELVQPFAAVGTDDVWMPGGFVKPAEAKLGETNAFLTEEQRRALVDWWLAVPATANKPNWDIASTCTIDGRKGLILVEAKAHVAELSDAGKPAGNKENDRSIRAALQQASYGLDRVIPGWNLTADSHYQLCNRFAWAWKIAALGVPVVLVYLGFLNAEEMASRSEPFRSGEKWADLVRDHTHGIVPEAAWNRELETDGAPFCALIRAVDLKWEPNDCGVMGAE